MRTLKEIEALLDEKIPRAAVEQRDGGGGRSLSYLTAHYVIDRLNMIFGPMNWTKEIVEIKEVVNTTSRGQFPAYLAKVRLTINAGGPLSSVKEAYGYGADKSGQNAHELAIKEAVSDALKVAAKDFGMSMGLALYSKEQENVQEEEPVAKASPTTRAVTIKDENPTTTFKASPAATPGITPIKATKEAVSSAPTRAQLLETTGAQAMVLQKVKGKSLDEVKAILTTSFGAGRSRQDLTDEELVKLSSTFEALLA